jgi:short-subunit dehydrogenase
MGKKLSAQDGDPHLRPPSGRVALITGASSGIGEAIVRELARRGALPVLAARRVERIEAIAQEIREGGGQALAVACDVSRDGDLERAAETAREAFGRIDIAIANAGFGIKGRIDRLSIDDFRRQFETNVFGVLRTIAATLPDIKRAQGCVTLIGSVNGYLSLPTTGAYAMSKAAVRALADALRAELRDDGVAVTHVAPGFVESEIRRRDNQGVFRLDDKEPVPRWLMMPAPEAARQIVDAIAARRDEVILTRHGRLAVSLARHAPGVASTAMGVAASRMGRDRGRS